MQGILLLAHGSRAKETEYTLEHISKMVSDMLPDMNIQTAYMEFGKVDIAEGINRLVEIGANSIKIIPYFLFEGIHIREDIPKEIAKYSEEHPDIKITMGKTLGTDPRLAEIVKQRIEEVAD